MINPIHFGDPQAPLFGVFHPARQAVVDERVAGAVFIDGYAYPTLHFWLNRLASFLSSPSRVVRFLARCGCRVFSRPGSGARTGDGDDAEQFGWELPPRAQTESELCGLIGRGVECLHIYSGEVSALYNYAAQFAEMYKSREIRETAHYAYIADADHTFSLPGPREELLRRICEWAVDHYPCGGVRDVGDPRP